MPQLLGLIILGAGAIAVFRGLKQVVDRLSEEHARHAEGQADKSMKNLGALELDPDSGIYKPRKS